MKILYMMHIDWRWIKQRPHFIAEQLTVDHEVMVAYRVNPSRSHLCSNTSYVRRRSLLPIPRRFGLWSERLDSSMQKVWVSSLASGFRPDMIWVTFPTLYSYLPAHLRKLPIVYDCMDDAPAFYKDKQVRERIVDAEGQLVNAASCVLCSSQTLHDRLSQRYNPNMQMHVLRNGLTSELFNSIHADTQPSHRNAGEPLNIAYVGTISSWFDFELIMNTLEKLKYLTVHLIGPKDTLVPKHDRIIQHGVIDRAALSKYVEKFDAFIMPFAVNPLIEGVDPVKLYEYIAFGKETIAVHYREIDRFAPYVHLYRSPDEFVELVELLNENRLERKSKPALTSKFLAENTWESRAEQLVDILAAINVSQGDGQ